MEELCYSALDIAAVRERIDALLLFDQVLHGQVGLVKADLGDAVVAVFIGNLLQLFLHKTDQRLGVLIDHLSLPGNQADLRLQGRI